MEVDAAAAADCGPDSGAEEVECIVVEDGGPRGSLKSPITKPAGTKVAGHKRAFSGSGQHPPSAKGGESNGTVQGAAGRQQGSLEALFASVSNA